MNVFHAVMFSTNKLENREHQSLKHSSCISSILYSSLSASIRLCVCVCVCVCGVCKEISCSSTCIIMKNSVHQLNSYENTHFITTYLRKNISLKKKQKQMDIFAGLAMDKMGRVVELIQNDNMEACAAKVSHVEEKIFIV